MKNSPHPNYRAYHSSLLRKAPYITIEPILDFDLDHFVNMLGLDFQPIQVNIGADSHGHKLPEPPKTKLLELISALESFTTVHQKPNLKRLLK
ncbi:MAG: hypothetical protein BWY70_00699 [Bacteroidetes bacterium ADurb.Bin408]|nr:MAG: hypothetical protein BWY70_00699 [Bacteroidetes bacterium ADurb.Bin408]